MRATDRSAIRAYCMDRAERYRITRDGDVHIYGSDNPTDRSHDYWQYVGTVDDVLHLIAQEQDFQRVLSDVAATLGRKGGQSKSARKQAAARENGKLGGRPKPQN